jgi:hypothetical protein
VGRGEGRVVEEHPPSVAPAVGGGGANPRRIVPSSPPCSLNYLRLFHDFEYLS